MKILKPGKVEQRKFVCPYCGCIFVARKSEINTDIDLYVCPQDGCHYYAIGWNDGEPYEEPTPTQTDREKLMTLVHDSSQKRANSWLEAAGIIADYLLAHGVTFREE